MGEAYHLTSSFTTMMPMTTLSFLIIPFLLLAYVVYQRRFHPLSRFPGPLLASLTDLWQCYQFFAGQQPYHLTDLHHRYGPIVRYGPDKLSVILEDAPQIIYVKKNKIMPKTEYYNSFGMPGRPNLFNNIDTENHHPRRRQLLKVFSPQAVEAYEPIMDAKIKQFCSKIRYFASTNPPTPFDLADLFWALMCDVMTDLLYGESWGMLLDHKVRPPIDIHALSLWGALSGAWSTGQPVISLLVALVPHPWAYKVFWQNIGYAMNREKKVKKRIASVADRIDLDRKDLLTKLIIESQGKEKGAADTVDIPIECYGFLIAGVHPPAAALTLLFYHLLHNAKCLQKATTEVRESFPQQDHGEHIYSNADVEQHFPYLRKSVKESFRLTPVFTMPLPRRVTEADGIIIGDQSISKNTTVSVCNHAYHHNQAMWPSDHQVFDPSRWDNPSPRLTELSKQMLHFGAGTRQCIGKVLATTIIQKVTATLLSEFDLELAHDLEARRVERGEFVGKMPPMISVGISELEGPLMVCARVRK